VSRDTIKEVNVVFGKYKVESDGISPNRHFAYLNIHGPVPETASVRWRSANGTQRSKVVRIASELPEHFQGEIVIRIGDNDDIALTTRPFSRLKQDGTQEVWSFTEKRWKPGTQ
jgi:hypothetical protein